MTNKTNKIDKKSSESKIVNNISTHFESDVVFQVTSAVKPSEIELSGPIRYCPDNYIQGYRIIQELNHHHEAIYNPDIYDDLPDAILHSPSAKILSLIDINAGVIANLKIITMNYFKWGALEK